MTTFVSSVIMATLSSRNGFPMSSHVANRERTTLANVCMGACQIRVQVNWITLSKNENRVILKSKMAAIYHVGSEWYQIAYQSI